MNSVIGYSAEMYKCDNCGQFEIHHITLYMDGNVYECWGCGYLTDTRPKEKINFEVLMQERWVE